MPEKDVELNGIDDIDRKEDAKIKLKAFHERYSEFWDRAAGSGEIEKMGARFQRPDSAPPFSLIQEGLNDILQEWSKDGGRSDLSLKKAFEMADGRLATMIDDGRPLPKSQDIVVITNTTQMLDRSGEHIRTVVMVLEPGE